MKKETQLPILKDIRDIEKAQLVLLNQLAANIDLSVSPVVVVPRKLRTVLVSQGATIEGVLTECKKFFPIWRYSDRNLDEMITSERTSKETYRITFKDTQEADEEYKNMSANDLKEKGISGTTLLERLIMELDYFKETDKHLDIDNWTLCAGSRSSDGYVPYVYWDVVGLHVRWTHADNRYSDLRARVAVS